MAELALRAGSEYCVARVVFKSLSAEGSTYPTLKVNLEARVTHPSGATIEAESLRGICSLGNEVIAEGEAKLPLNTWYSNYERQFELRFHLTDKALKLVENSLTGDYLKVKFTMTGVGQWTHSPGPTRRGQFDETPLEVELSRIDWVNKVLKPSGWGDYFFVAYPIPTLPAVPEYKDITKWLKEMWDKLALGDDRGVFPLAYDAVHRFYSEREQLTSRIAETNKAGVVKDLVEEIHRFANGGRHRPEERREKGGFEVNRQDAELIRGLTIHLASYIAHL